MVETFYHELKKKYINNKINVSSYQIRFTYELSIIRILNKREVKTHSFFLHCYLIIFMYFFVVVFVMIICMNKLEMELFISHLIRFLLLAFLLIYFYFSQINCMICQAGFQFISFGRCSHNDKVKKFFFFLQIFDFHSIYSFVMSLITLFFILFQ